MARVRRRAPLFLAAIAAWIALAPRVALAYRPFDGTDADVAERGEFELELGPLGYFRLGDTNFLILPGAVLNYGILPRTELVLQGFNYIQVGGLLTQPRDQLLDTQLTAKVVLREGCLQDRPGVSVATEDGVLLPNVNGDVTVGATAAGILSQCFSNLIVHYNAQVQLDLEHALELFGSVILEGPRRWPVRPVAELYADTQVGGRSSGSEAVGSVLQEATVYSGLLGAIWRVSANLDIDSAVRAASVGGLWNLEVRLGLTWRVR
jgi:hypothetical protein